MNYMFPRPTHDLMGRKIKRRMPFKVSTKKREWNKSAGRDEYTFKTTSRCRRCPTKLIWGNRSYEFDHKDNNNSNNTQSNCYLVCRNCHGKATKTKKIRVRGMMGEIRHKTVKVKIDYKKVKRSHHKKKRNKSRTRRTYNPILGEFKPPTFKQPRDLWGL